MPDIQLIQPLILPQLQTHYWLIPTQNLLAEEFLQSKFVI